MQHGVRGAAQSHVGGQAILDRLIRHNIAGAHIITNEIHDLHTCALSQDNALALNCGNGTVARQAQPQKLCHAVHGVGGEHTGAGAAAGAGVLHQFLCVLRAHLTGAHSAGCLEGVGQGYLLAIGITRQHRPAGAEDGRDIQPQGGHQHTGHDLVAVRDEH